jgi:hypothetical protein
MTTVSNEYDLTSKSILRQLISLLAYQFTVNFIFSIFASLIGVLFFDYYYTWLGRTAPHEPVLLWAGLVIINMASAVALTVSYMFSILALRRILHIFYCIIISIITMTSLMAFSVIDGDAFYFDMQDLRLRDIVSSVTPEILGMGLVHGSFSYFMMKQEFFARYGKPARSEPLT